jgi:hypothetical protein
MCLTFYVDQNVEAAKIFKWTDEEGGVHFSDVLPDDTTIIETRVININISNNNNVDPGKYSIINQADRMAERRRQIAEERLAKKKLQLEAKRLALELERNRQNEIITAQQYEPRSYYYTFPHRHIHHQSHGLKTHARRNHHQSIHLHSSRNVHRGRVSTNHQRFNSHHFKVGLRSK